MTYFTELKQIFQKIYMEPQKIPNCHSNIGKEEQVGGTMLPDIKLYYKTIGIKTAWYWHKNRHIGQWNRIKSSEIPHSFIVN